MVHDSSTDRTKIPGRPASEVWDIIPVSAKINLVIQLARHVLSIFQLRFTLSGSLYMTAGKYHVGPLVDPVFYEGVAGEELISSNSPDCEARLVWGNLQELRGPYMRTTTWLAHRISAEAVVFKATHPSLMSGVWTPGHPSHYLEVLAEAADLCWLYPGENPVINNAQTPDQPFSFMLENDLSNMMVCPFLLSIVLT